MINKDLSLITQVKRTALSRLYSNVNYLLHELRKYKKDLKDVERLISSKISICKLTAEKRKYSRFQNFVIDWPSIVDVSCAHG